jgi:MFS family permease
MLALAPLPPFPVVLATLFVFGVCLGAVVPMQTTVVHERTPPVLRGRVFGIFVASTTATGALGMLVAGLVVDSAGLRRTLLLLAAGFGAFVIRGLVDLRATPEAYPRRVLVVRRAP